MPNLNFKWGPYANLDGVAKSAGTVYITTDERSMYVDVNDETRIRVQGSVLYYDSVEQFTKDTTPPYATDVLYFFRKIKTGDNAATNALMAYTGTDWVQVNITKEDFDAQVLRISNLETQTTSLSTNLTNLTNRVATLEGYVGTPKNGDVAATGMHKDIADLKAAIGTGTTNESLGARVSKLETDTAQLTTDVGTLTTTTTSLSTNKADKTYVDKELAKKIDETVVEATYATKTELSQQNKSLTDAIDTKVDKIAYNEKMQGLDSSITTINSSLSTKADKTYVDAQLKTKIDETEVRENFATKNELTTKVNELSGAIALKADQTAVTALETSKADKDYVDTQLEKKLNADTAAVTYATKTELSQQNKSLTDAIDTKVDKITYNEKMQGLDTSITNLTNDKADKTEVAKKLDTTVAEQTYATKTQLSQQNESLTNLIGTKVDSEAYNEKMQSLDGSITNLTNTKADKTEVASLKTTLEQQIKDDVKAVNALTYKGTITSTDDLPTSDVKIGDMYVASGANLESGVAPGDLFVAKGTENGNGIISSNLEWEQVKTGYDTLLQPTLSLDSTTNTFTLNNYVHQSLGSVQIVSSNDNLSISSKDGVITISNTWGTF